MQLCACRPSILEVLLSNLSHFQHLLTSLSTWKYRAYRKCYSVRKKSWTTEGFTPWTSACTEKIAYWLQLCRDVNWHTAFYKFRQWYHIGKWIIIGLNSISLDWTETEQDCVLLEFFGLWTDLELICIELKWTRISRIGMYLIEMNSS